VGRVGRVCGIIVTFGVGKSLAGAACSIVDVKSEKAGGIAVGETGKICHDQYVGSLLEELHRSGQLGAPVPPEIRAIASGWVMLGSILSPHIQYMDPDCLL